MRHIMMLYIEKELGVLSPSLKVSRSPSNRGSGNDPNKIGREALCTCFSSTPRSIASLGHLKNRKCARDGLGEPTSLGKREACRQQPASDYPGLQRRRLGGGWEGAGPEAEHAQ